MWRAIVGTGAAALVMTGAAVAALVVWPIGEPPDPIALEGDVERGAYLARASGCIACSISGVISSCPPIIKGVTIRPGTMVFTLIPRTDRSRAIGKIGRAHV